MYTWPGTPFNGDKYKIDSYIEVLTQQLRANNCLKIAKNEEEPQQQQQQQQQGGNSSNASQSSNSTSTRSTINAVISSTATITPTTTDLQNTQLKIAEHERKSELGLAIICMRINNNYENNNISTSNPLLKQNTMHNSIRNFSNNYIRENSPNIILNRSIKKF